MKQNAFSLIELMVVIAIIALLAAVAVPVYGAYRVRTNVATAYSTLLSWQESLLAQYQSTGSYPSSFSFMGTSVPNTGGGVDLTASGANNAAAIANGFDTILYKPMGPNADGVWAQANLNYPKLGLPAPTTAYVLRSVVILNSNGVFNFYCGTWTAAGQEIPAQYLPSQCTCTNMQNIWSWTSGAAPSC